MTRSRKGGGDGAWGQELPLACSQHRLGRQHTEASQAQLSNSWIHTTGQIQFLESGELNLGTEDYLPRKNMCEVQNECVLKNGVVGGDDTVSEVWTQHLLLLLSLL